MDPSNDALVLALGKKLGKLTPELEESFLHSILSRMTVDKRGWPGYGGGPADPSITSIVLLCLQSVGVTSDDPRIKTAWEFFEEQGGIKKLSFYAGLMLQPLGLVPDSQRLTVSPRIFGLPHFSPIQVDTMGLPRGFVVPFVGLDYLSRLPDNSLINDHQTSAYWQSQPIQIGKFRLLRFGVRGQRACAMPVTDRDALLAEVKKNPQEYKNCVFYNPKAQSENTSASAPSQVKGGTNAVQPLINTGNFVMEHLISGNDVYWAEQAVSWELQNRNPGRAWYGTIFSIFGVRMLQEASRDGMGDFHVEIDQAWNEMLNWRVVDQDGLQVEQLMRTGIWDTATTMMAFDALKGTQWALSDADASASVKWLLDRQIKRDSHSPSTPMVGWSFDQYDSSVPDVDDTANVIHVIASYADKNDPAAQAAIEAGSNWIRAQQNQDGGFPAWGPGASVFVSDTLHKKENLPTFEDLSQADISGRVLFSFAGIQSWLKNPDADLSSAQRACDFFAHDMPILSGTSLHLAPGHWMVNYTYSASNVLLGMTQANCDFDQQAELARFIRETQQADGGWGEGFDGYASSTYVAAPSTISQTAVTLSGLMAYYEILPSQSDERNITRDSIEKGVQYLIKKSHGGRNLQEEDTTGVLMKGMMYARYELLPAYTSLYALGRWEHLRSAK
jgi:squalene cyclase